MPAQSRTIPARIAASASVAVGLGFWAAAALSLSSGHGQFSGEIAVLLAGYGLLLVAAGVAAWRGVRLAQGAVLSLGLLDLLVAGSSLTQPGAWLLLAASAITVVAGVVARVRQARAEA